MPTNRQFSIALQALTELKTRPVRQDACWNSTCLARCAGGDWADSTAKPCFLALRQIIYRYCLICMILIRDPCWLPEMQEPARRLSCKPSRSLSLQTHNVSDVQFGVITNYPDEWESDRSHSSPCWDFLRGTPGHAGLHEFAGCLGAFQQEYASMCVLVGG